MNIRTVALAVFFGAALTMGGGAYGIGIGVQFNGNAADVFYPGAALAVSPGNTTHLALNWNFRETSMLGVTMDVWAFNPKFGSFNGGRFGFFIGGGLYTNLVLYTDTVIFHGGFRFPIGFQVLFGRDAFEIFFQGAPSIGLRFYPSFEGDNFFAPLAIGARIWFR
ncbi:MAG: hypothetical protein LBG76_01410 [Treponema sp.]|nr:hypothetical protein [Treponema sp.]